MILLINYSHKWWYKALSVLLVVALILAISFGAAPRAHAVGVLTITVCAAILAVMAGAGIATVCAGMTSNDIQSWMQSKLEEWDLYRNDGNIFSDLIQNNLITTTVKGTLAIGNGAARGISDFITWLKNDLSLIDNTTYNNIIVTNDIDLSQIFNITYESFYGVSSQQYITVSNNNAILNTKSLNKDSQVNFIYSNGNNSTVIEFDFTFNSDIPTQWTSNVIVPRLYSGGTLTLTNNINCLKSGSDFVYPTRSGTSSGSGHIKIQNSNSFALRSFDSYVSFNIYNLTINNQIIGSGTDSSLSLDTDVINIPSVADDGQTDIVIGIDGVYPGATTDEAADVIMDGVLDNTLDTTMTVTDEYVDAVEAVVINEQPISVNTDHHMIGFTNLPDFVNLNLNSIWHYVSNAVEYASGFISWFVNLLSSVPTLAIPLYMSFTLLIVLSFIRRILL